MSKQLLTDLLNEMKSKCISDVFEVQGHTYEMQLLNGEESDWRNNHIPLKGFSLSKGMDKASISMGAINAIKRPTLAISIRKIDGESVESLFESDWTSLSTDEKSELLAESEEAQRWFTAERLSKFLAEFPGDIIEELWKNFDLLTGRRDEAKAAVKKSSGESEADSTKLSPSGEE